MANEPLASGTLAKTPFPHLLIYLEQHSMSGTLAVWPDEAIDGSLGQDRILVLKGRPMAGLLLTQAPSLRAGMLAMFRRREAPYAFYEGNLLGSADNRLSERIEPLSLIAESLRNDDARDDVVASVLGAIGDAQLRMSANVDFKRYDLTAQERGLVDLLMAEPASINDIVALSSLEQMQALRLVYLLLISKAIAPYDPAHGGAQMSAPPPPPEPDAADMEAAQLEAPAAAQPTHPAVIPDDDAPATHVMVIPGDDPQPVTDAGRVGLQSIPPPPDDIDKELRLRWQKIVTKGKLIDNQNYFEMLELRKDTSGSDAKAKFLKLAKEWHPDRLPKELESLKASVQIIFGYMSEANTCLSNEEERLEYLKSVREGGGTPAAERLMERILDSAMQYERVMVFERKHEYDKALEVLKRILANTTDEPDYHAMHGWLLMQMFPNKPGVDAPFEEMLACFERAIELHVDHERAHQYKGQVLRRLGRGGEALTEFKKVVRLNPKNVEAAREVRIANMRVSQSMGGTKKNTGLLSRFFKK